MVPQNILLHQTQQNRTPGGGVNLVKQKGQTRERACPPLPKRILPLTRIKAQTGRIGLNSQCWGRQEDSKEADHQPHEHGTGVEAENTGSDGRKRTEDMEIDRVAGETEREQ